jgi:NADPH:quinone reductase-like Zn-dependent oxidoreductase
MSVETTRHKAEWKSGSGEHPKIIHAAAIDRFGGPEMLTMHELPVPEVGDDEVLIALDTVGVGSWDAAMRGGWWPEGKPRFPAVLGTDGSGHVAARGAHVHRLKPGEAVYAYSFANSKGGFYADYVVVSAERVAPVPKGLTLREAGAIPTTGLTAIQGIDSALRVKAGESVAIVGASGGVGTLAVQFAKLREARVFCVASGGDGVELVLRLGADAAIDGHAGDLSVAVSSFAPDGLDAVLALAGGPTLDSMIRNVKNGGRIAYPNGVDPEPKKHPKIQVMSYDAVPGVREFEHLAEAIESMKFTVPIEAAFPLEDAAQSHRRLEQGHVLGKIVLDIP